MKPSLYLLFFVILFWQCQSNNSDSPKPVLKIVFPKKIIYNGVTIDFRYTNTRLTSIDFTKGSETETLEYVRLSDGKLAKVVVKKEEKIKSEYAFETDNKGRIIKMLKDDKLRQEYRYDVNGHLTEIIDQSYKSSTSFLYAGGNLAAHCLHAAGNSQWNHSKAIKWDRKSNPSFSLNTASGFIFPAYLGLKSMGYLNGVFNVLSENNPLEIMDSDYNTVVRKYEFEYRDGLPVKRKTFNQSYDILATGTLKYKGTFIEDPKELVLYDY